jgi:hypothetical protein
LKSTSIAAIAILLIAASNPASAMEISVFPTAEIDELYNSNVQTTSNNPKGDWITAQLLGGKVDASSRNRDFYLTYSTIFTENAWYQNLDRFARDHNLQINDTERLSASTTLHISDTFLRGNATSGQFFTNSTEPVSPQLLTALLYNYRTTTQSNDFSAGISYVNQNMLTWSSEVHQNFFSTSSSSAAQSATPGLSFDQGGSLAVNRLLGERFSIGLGYQFDDFRFSNGVPTSDSHMPMLKFAWGAGTSFSLQASAGPVIVSSSAGVIGATRVAATTTVEPGFGFLATYAGERFDLQGSAGEGSGVSAGFGGQTNNITTGALLQYKLTRRALLFANVGYFNFSGSSVSGYSFSYAAGASYRLTRHISLTGEYYGYRTLGNGAGAIGLAGTPGQATVTNVFMFGMVFQLAPWKWELD